MLQKVRQKERDSEKERHPAKAFFFFLKKDLPLVQTSMKTESLVPLRAVHRCGASDSFPDLIRIFLSNILFPLNQADSSLALKTDPEASFLSVTEVKQ